MNNPFSNKTVAEIRAAMRGLDDGFCNPIKHQMAQEDRADAIRALEDRGYSRAEAQEIIDGDD